MANGFQLNGAKPNGSVLYGVGSLRKPLPLSLFGEEEEAPEEEVVEDEADSSNAQEEEFGFFESAPAPVESISAEELGFGDFNGGSQQPAAAEVLEAELFGDFSAPAQPGKGNLPASPTNDWLGESLQLQSSSSDWESAAPTSTLMLAMHGIHGTLKPSARHSNKSSLPAPANVVNAKVVPLPAPTNLVDAKVVAAEDPDDWGDFVEPELGTAVASPGLLALPARPSKDRVKANGSHFQMLDLISLDAGPAPPLMLDLHSSSPAETATKGGDLLLLSWDDDPLPPTEIPVAIEVNGQTGKKTEDLLAPWEDGERMETIVGVEGVTAAPIEVNGQTGKTDLEDLLVSWDDGQPVEPIVGGEGVTATPVAAVEVNGQTGKNTDVEDLLVAWDDEPGTEGVTAAQVAAVEVNGQAGKETDVEDFLVAWEDGQPVEHIAGMEGVTAGQVAAVEVNGQAEKKTDVKDFFVAWDDGEPVEPIVGMEGVTAAEEQKGTTVSSMTTDAEGLKGTPASYPRSTSLPAASFPDFISSLYPEPEEKSSTIARSHSSGNLTGECESRTTEWLSRDLFEDQIKDQTSGDPSAMLEDKTSELLPSNLFKDEGTVNYRTTDKLSSTTLNHEIDFLDFEGPLLSDSSNNAISYVDMLAELKVPTMDDGPVLAKRQQIQSRYVRAWNSLVSACAAELNHALGIWREATGTRCCNQVLATEQGKRYYLAVAEVYKVAKVIEASARVYIRWLDAAPELKSSLQTALVQCETAWASLDSTVEPAAAKAVKNLEDALVSLVESSLPVGDPETSQGHCCSSLLPFHSVPGVAVAQWRGRRCLLPVANFWANRVSCDPPFATS